MTPEHVVLMVSAGWGWCGWFLWWRAANKLQANARTIELQRRVIEVKTVHIEALTENINRKVKGLVA
jgi:hypothetical protein